MKRLIGTLVWLGALAGPLALETESSSTAQQTDLVATLSPVYVAPGGQVTVTSQTPCPQAMQVHWSLGPGAQSGTVTTAANGSWVVRFAAPTAAGVTPFFAYCTVSPGGNAVALYRQLSFTVAARTPPRFTG